MKFIRALTFIFLLCSMASSAFSQVAFSTETVNSGGNSFRNNNVLIEWSIGEMTMIHTVSSPGFIVSNGILQPLKYKTDIKEPAKKNLQLYPSITSGSYVTLTGSFTEKGKLYIAVSSTLGQIINREVIPVNVATLNHKIEIQSFQKAEYFIKVIFVNEDNTQQYQHTFKLIKS